MHKAFRNSKNLSWVTLAKCMTKDIEIDAGHEPVLILIHRGQRAVHPDIHEYSRSDPDTRPLVPWTMKAQVEYHKRPIQYCHYDLFAQNTIQHCYNPQKPRRTKSHRWNKTFLWRNSILLFVAKLIISWFELNEGCQAGIFDFQIAYFRLYSEKSEKSKLWKIVLMRYFMIKNELRK